MRPAIFFAPQKENGNGARFRDMDTYLQIDEEANSNTQDSKTQVDFVRAFPSCFPSVLSFVILDYAKEKCKLCRTLVLVGNCMRHTCACGRPSQSATVPRCVVCFEDDQKKKARKERWEVRRNTCCHELLKCCPCLSTFSLWLNCLVIACIMGSVLAITEEESCRSVSIVVAILSFICFGWFSCFSCLFNGQMVLGTFELFNWRHVDGQISLGLSCFCTFSFLVTTSIYLMLMCDDSVYGTALFYLLIATVVCMTCSCFVAVSRGNSKHSKPIEPDVLINCLQVYCCPRECCACCCHAADIFS